MWRTWSGNDRMIGAIPWPHHYEVCLCSPFTNIILDYEISQ